MVDMPDTKNDQNQSGSEKQYYGSSSQDGADRGTGRTKDFADQGGGKSEDTSSPSRAEKAAESVLDKTSVGRTVKPVLKVIGRNKGKSGIVGGILTLILTLVLAGFLGLKQFELIHMMKIFQNYAFVASEYTEGSRTSRLLGKTLQNGRKMDPDRANMEGNRRRTGRLVSDWINDSRLNKLESNLQKKGYEIDYKTSGNGTTRVATRIRKPNGESIELNKFRQARGELRSLIKEEIPAYRVGKRFRYYRLMNYRTGWNRKFFVGRGARNAAQRLRSRVRGESEISRARRGETEIDEERRAQADQELTEQRNKVNSVVEDARQGRSINVRATGIGLSVTGFVMMKCLAENITEETEGRHRARYEAPMSLGQEMSTAADQAKVGGNTVSSQEYGELMEVYHDPATQESEGKHWDETAAYKRAAGVRTTGNEPDLEDNYFTAGGGVGRVINLIISKLNDFFELGDTICSVAGNTGVQIGADVAEFVLSGFGAGKAIFIGIEWGADLLGGTEYAIRKTIQFLAGNLSCMQFTTSPHLAANCLSAGMVLNNTEHVRSNMGAPPLPESEHNDVRDKAKDAQHNFLAQKGFFYRYFSPDNSRSITTKTAIALPKTLGETKRKAANIPSSILDSLSSIFVRPADAQSEQGSEYETYGLETFGFTNEEIQRIDPVENEKMVGGYLRYYCWEEKIDDEIVHYQTPGVQGCSHGRVKIASHMREYLYCTQLPYNPSEEEDDNWRENDQCQKYRRNRGPLSSNMEGEPAVVRTGMWLFDRYTAENLSQLTTDDNLDDEVTFVLLDNIEKCVEKNGESPGSHGEDDPGKPCYTPPANEQSIFRSKGYIEGERIRPTDSTTDEGGGDDPSPMPNDSLQYPPDLNRGGCPEPYYRIPEAPDGKYVIYASQSRRCGKKELIGVLYTTALNYYDKYGPGSKLYIGDLNGGDPHKSHKWGIAADLDAAANPRAADHKKGNYSTSATVDLGKMLVDTGFIKNIWWCDPGDGSTEAIRDYAQDQGTPINIKCITGHDTHFHIDIKGSKGPVHAP